VIVLCGRGVTLPVGTGTQHGACRPLSGPRGCGGSALAVRSPHAASAPSVVALPMASPAAGPPNRRRLRRPR